MAWYFKSDLRFKGDEGWTIYSPDENDALEKAYKGKEKSFKLNSTYKINFDKMIQYRIDDETRQRDIKREDHAYPKTTSIVGKKVFIVGYYKQSQMKIVGVYADKEDAKKAKKQKKSKGEGTVEIFEKTIA